MPISSFQNRIRYFNKYLLNRLTRRIAASSRGPFGLVRHVGRRSGKVYETPVNIRKIDGGFAVALTYGAEVDWYRNVLASGGCRLRWHGREYVIDRIESLDAATALPMFSRLERVILRRLGTDHFVRLHDRDV